MGGSMYTFLAVLSTLLCVCPAVSQVLINEVLYDPDGTDTGKEKIEIKNAGSTSIDLTGYDLYPDGIGYFTFPTVSLPPGAIAVVHLRQPGVNTGSDFFHPTPSSNLGNASGGSVALFSSTTHNAGALVSFVQWGAGSRGWASAAASAGVWSSVSDSVPAVSEGHSIEYDGSGFTPGDWFDQVAPTLGSPNALPVELISFSARRIGASVFLSWETVSEVDNYGFDVERRKISPIDTDAREYESQNNSILPRNNSLFTPSPSLRASLHSSQWVKIGFVPGAATSQIRRRYSFVDGSPFHGKAVYRLRQLDRDGAFSFSDVAEVDFTEWSRSVILDCYPNPFNPSVQLSFSVPDEGDVLLRVFDAAGRMVKTLYSGAAKEGVLNTVTLTGENLASGVYFAACEFKGTRISKRILLLR